METFIEKKQEDNEDRGEVRTVFARSHADIREGGKKMCERHVWKRLSDNEVECMMCPTALVVQVDDERLLGLDG